MPPVALTKPASGGHEQRLGAARYPTWLSALLAATLLEVLPFFAIRSLQPPPPVSETAPPRDFSSARAARHVAALAREPHPAGTPEHARVQQYLLRELEHLSLVPRVHEVRTFRALGPQGESVILKNLSARLPGTGGTRAILLAAHYDTSPRAPGAADDSAAVAALLETARALRSGPALRNDVVLLFTDGEEQGLLGAFGFVREEEWAHTIGLVLNFDARGNSGPVIMFETSPGNTALIREFARAVPHPVASSLTHTVYSWLPNRTDFTAFRERGLPGFNFAMIDGFPAYHSALDTPENLSEASLQHQGSYALALVRHFGDLDLSAGALEANADAVYFNGWGGWLIWYDRPWALTLAALTAILFAALVWVGFRRGVLRGQLTIRKMFAGFESSLFQAMVATIVLAALVYLAGLLGVPSPLTVRGENLGSTLVTLALWNVALTITVLAYKPERSSPTFRATLLGHAFPWLVLSLLTSLFLPGASYLCTWPLLLALPGYAFHLTRKPETPLSRFGVGTILLCGIPALALMAQTIYLFLLALTPPRFPHLAIGLLVVLFLSLLTQGLLLPQLELVYPRSRRRLPVLAAVGISAAGGFLCAAWVLGG